MAAVPYVTVGDFADNMRYLASDIPQMSAIVAFIFAEQTLNPGWLLIDLTEEQLNDILRKVTGLTVALNPDINCYPRGADLVQCFDLNGDPVP